MELEIVPFTPSEHGMQFIYSITCKTIIRPIFAQEDKDCESPFIAGKYYYALRPENSYLWIMHGVLHKKCAIYSLTLEFKNYEYNWVPKKLDFKYSVILDLVRRPTGIKMEKSEEYLKEIMKYLFKDCADFQF
jgi:hypothetical protein